MSKTLRLKKNEERRLVAGHLWIYSNEIDVATSPLSGFEPGDLADVRDSRDRVLGTAYVNPHSLICARLISRQAGVALDPDLLGQRIRRAAALREQLFDRPWYRLVYGEADALPGLVIDRFDTTAVVQLTTAGMERCKPAIVDVLKRAIGLETIIFRNDSPIRAMEGLELYIEALPETAERIRIEENGVHFEIMPLSGQKTGWFFDHRMTRARLPAYVHDRRVLDVFSYSGAWGVQAAVGGARQVTCIDESHAALELLRRNIEINGIGDRTTARQGEAFETLKAMYDAGETFDVVILDPPAFVKRRKDIKVGLKAYQRINQLAMRLLGAEGILITNSCSFHVTAEDLKQVVLNAGVRLGCELRILEQGHQGPDHPIHPAIEETAYLKSLIVHVARPS